ncbi:hypothetical protein EXE46_12460 [Halorubrum sp. GN11_10-6_MGM]|uniref:hypothetical protein n=1 Tax=Halorubrum sp. GN11_10-6_MGM TaxID=2518112 RepID=UPI0010F69111|nr:hypothetical protein [Halorubrum sp. GN11_10-6_MGM]TKX73756.1 hypothetical protein EXE46_12460 [Halorubrum sp. GN11_10-6_MGM]
MDDISLEAILEGVATIGDVPPFTFRIARHLLTGSDDSNLVIDVYYNGSRINIAAGPSRIGESTYRNIKNDMWNRVDKIIGRNYPGLSKSDRNELIDDLSSRLEHQIKSKTSSPEEELRATAEVINFFLNSGEDSICHFLEDVFDEELS